MQTISPILCYDDAREAIRWLSSAFGFVQLFSVPESRPYVRHAQIETRRERLTSKGIPGHLDPFGLLPMTANKILK